MSETQVPDPPRQSEAAGVRIVAGLSLFAAIYLGSFVVAGFVAVAMGLHATYWIALGAAAFATWWTVRIVEHGNWAVGFFVAPRLAIVEGCAGLVFAALVIGSADLLIIATTALRQLPGNGFPWLELLVVFLPAAIHEELLFRGYVYQRIRAWNRGAAIAVTSLLFSALHAGNGGVTAIALVNLALAGVLLALAYDRYERLWFPIGIHFAWNVLSGPVLGYDVSGYRAVKTLLRTAGSGASWATGGSFGIEGSAWMIPVELVAIAVLAIGNRRRPPRGPAGELTRG